ncbi:hypothetical protein AAFF_G00322720 [Aldrovandia affinis]|uniref:Uncharacterized protein n=1 Tax=Aldrovandia affinis TaxID=143900 RepID=A0AAD7WQ41_9TELE|nr:hypothetical protein AAFF_G00322720 [Aldrovandia affinis]
MSGGGIFTEGAESEPGESLTELKMCSELITEARLPQRQRPGPVPRESPGIAPPRRIVAQQCPCLTY